MVSLNPNLLVCLGQTALHVACERGTVDCVKQLVRSGAGLNALDRDMQTPLDFADRATNGEAKNIVSCRNA